MNSERITLEYIYRMWGGAVSMEEIEAGLKEIRSARNST